MLQQQTNLLGGQQQQQQQQLSQAFNQQQRSPAPNMTQFQQEFQDFLLKDDFQVVVPFPDKNSLSREIRYSMSYYQQNRMLQTSKW